MDRRNFTTSDSKVLQMALNQITEERLEKFLQLIPRVKHTIYYETFWLITEDKN